MTKNFIHSFVLDINHGYEEAFRYKQLDRFSIKFLWWNLATLVLLTVVNTYFRLADYILSPFSWRVIEYQEAIVVLCLGLLAFLIPRALRNTFSTHYYYRIVVTTCLILFSYLFVYVSGGSIEAHFHFFVVITYLAAYADWRLGWIALVLTTLHHVLLDFIAPEWVFFYGQNFLSPFAHIVPVIAASILSGVLSKTHREALLSQKELEKRREEFISMAAHELKTPVMTISIFTEVMEYSLSKEQRGQFLKPLLSIREQLSKLDKLINDLLDISRSDARKFSYTFSQFDLDVLVREVVSTMGQFDIRRRIVVSGKVSRPIWGDRDRISQVLVNLLSNALKYSPLGSDVAVDITSDEKAATVCVVDQGEGIDPEHHSKIFERFYRVYDDRGRTYPGMGIGLYVSSVILERHGGRIWVESKKGSGSKFFFSLPFSKSGENSNTL